jgi:hypothetical protein
MGDIMRNLAIGGWILAVLLGGVLYFILRPISPQGGFGDCPSSKVGTIFGIQTKTPISDQIISGPHPGKLKIRYATAPGVCVDGQSGNIHLYHLLTTGGDFTLTFASNLAGQAAWPLNASDAIQTADSPNGPWAPVPGAAVTANGATLTFSIPTTPGHNYFYRLQYTNPGGVPGNLQPVDPAIQNH